MRSHSSNEFRQVLHVNWENRRAGAGGLNKFPFFIRRRFHGAAKVAGTARRVRVGDADLSARQFGRNDGSKEARRQNRRRPEGGRRADQVVPQRGV